MAAAQHAGNHAAAQLTSIHEQLTQLLEARPQAAYPSAFKAPMKVSRRQ
jgi:hypothetical protein